LITKQCGRTVLPDCFVYLSCFPAFCVLSFLDNWLNTARIPVTEPLLLAWTVGLGTHNKRERTVTYLGGLLSPAGSWIRMSFYVFRFGLFWVSVAFCYSVSFVVSKNTKNVVSLGVALHYLFMDTFLSPRALVRGPDRAGPAAIKNWDLRLDFLLKTG
jgi:hypothetical protein